MVKPGGKDEQGFTDYDRDLAYWVGLLLPPIAWGIQLQTVYLTSEFGCYTSDFLWNHIVSVAMFVLSIFGGFIAYTKWRSLASGTDTAADSPIDRKRFMAIGGMLLGVLFAVLIFAQWLPTLMGVPCEK
jgi:hypothetical protein